MNKEEKSMTLMEQILSYMDAKGIKQYQLAQATDIDEGNMSTYLHDKGNPGYKQIMKICDALGLEIIVRECK